MRAFDRPLLLAVATAAAFLIPLPAKGATEHPVLTTPAGEYQPARGPNHLAWEQNTKAQPNHYDVFVQPDGGGPVRVNAGPSNAAMGGIGDDLLVYQQYRKKQSDLFLFDLNSGQRTRLPKKVNSKLWEYWPSISEPWLLFGRWKMSNDVRLIILRNLETGEQRVLNRIRGSGAFIGPGQVNGDYVVWWRCPTKARCQVYRYQISTATKIKVPNPGSYQRAPSVNAEGTVFLSRGGKGCGGAVQIVKIAPDGTETILTQFPEGLDSRDTYAYTDEGGVTHVHYERFGCGKKTGSDIFQVMDPEITGSITVIKEALPPAPQPFEFDPSPNLQAANFFLNDGGLGPNQQEFTGLAAGTYTVQEVNLPPSWQIVDLECVGDTDGDTTSGISLATINLDPGEHIVCTYTNAKEGSITIVKDSIPNDAEDFEFDPSANLQITNFLLDDDPGSARPSQETFPDLDVPVTYSVQEVNIPSDWELTGIDCVGGGLDTAGSIATATATIGLDASEAVVCTFENTKNGQIRVTKQTNPNGSGQSFTFTRSYGPNFNLTDGQTHDSGFTLAPGSYSIQENVPGGWQLAAACTDGSAPGSIDLSAGETVTCTFTNTQNGRIRVTKQTDPNGSGQSFTFTRSYGPDFILTNGQTHDSGSVLAPGTYSVAENPVAGWDLTGATCSDGSAPGSIDLSAGETVTCTFNNRQDGRIVVAKETTPDGSPQSFEFDADYGPNFFLQDGQTNDSGFLDPGTYSVSEITPFGWDLTSTTCSDSSAPGSIDLSAGETVTCTFNNRQDGRIVVAKETIPDGSPQNFTFSRSYGPDFVLSDGQSSDSGFTLNPGTYSVSETVPAGWTLTDASCSDGSAPAAISLSPGETVTCTFTNTEQGSITIALDVVPDDPQDFDFSAAGGLSPSAFTLDDDDDLPLPSGTSDTRVYSGVLPGTYTVTETIPPLPWKLDSVACVDPDNGSSGDTVTATATIDLDPGEAVTCTFTNSLLP